MYPVYLEQGSNKNTGSRYGCNEIYYLRHTNISAVALVSLLSNNTIISEILRTISMS